MAASFPIGKEDGNLRNNLSMKTQQAQQLSGEERSRRKVPIYVQGPQAGACQQSCSVGIY